MTPQMERLTLMVDRRGWRCRAASIARLEGLREATAGRHERGLIDDELYRVWLSSLSFDPPAELSAASSILVVAVPTPPMRVTFRWKGERVPLVVPPTYVSYTSRTERVQAELAAWLEREGYGMARPRLPLKTLAVCSGLAEYGRNNICYVPGMGSFLQLVGAFTDLPADDDPWREPRALDRCESCVACRRECPTGAIPWDRFLLRAERCLSYYNEATADLPAWIDPSSHQCLIGCMRCQAVCPENRAVRDWLEDRAEFSERETELLLRREPLDRMPRETAAKLRGLEINGDHRLLGRTLALILERGTPAA